MVGDDETSFSHKLLLTSRQVANLCRAYTNKSSTSTKLSKTQISKMVQSEGFISRLLGPLLKNIVKPLAKSVSILLGLTASVSATDAWICKKILGSVHSSCSASQNNTILIISNNEMEDIVEIVKSLEDSGLLFAGVSELKFKMKLKNKMEDLLVCY